MDFYNLKQFHRRQSVCVCVCYIPKFKHVFLVKGRKTRNTTNNKGTQRNTEINLDNLQITLETAPSILKSIFILF